MSRALALLAVAACSSPRAPSPLPALPERPAFQWAHAVADPSYAVVRKPMDGAHARVAGPPGWTCSADVTPGSLGEESGALSCEHDGHRVQTLAMCTTGPTKPSDCAWATLRIGSAEAKLHVLGLSCSSPGRRCAGDSFVTDYAHYTQADVPAKPRFTWTREGTATGDWSCAFTVDPQLDDAAGTHFEVGRLTCRAGADLAETAIVCAESPGGPPFCNAGSLRLGRPDGGSDAVMITCRTSGATCSGRSTAVAAAAPQLATGELALVLGPKPDDRIVIGADGSFDLVFPEHTNMRACGGLCPRRAERFTIAGDQVMQGTRVLMTRAADGRVDILGTPVVIERDGALSAAGRRYVIGADGRVSPPPDGFRDLVVMGAVTPDLRVRAMLVLAFVSSVIVAAGLDEATH